MRLATLPLVFPVLLLTSLVGAQSTQQELRPSAMATPLISTRSRVGAGIRPAPVEVIWSQKGFFL